MPQSDQILPLLEGFMTGDPMSDHHGVSCSPAMRDATGEKYILKAISVPASAQQMEALLLAGAFSDRASALAYFKELAEGIVEEAVLLQRLSRLEGFTAYENWQVVPKENEEGFDVYLLGAYRPTLERYLSRNPMTHLGAVNLGLDLCSALAVCRRSGHLYVDLKPSNIFICDDHEFRIGDLGFIPLSSLKYASLPEKYRSAYTAPEISDAYSALNESLDIYAVGLILYQVYNNGVLPFEGSAPSEPLPPPEHADYEMATIILKACDPNPETRWQDPAQMGQALVAYMQKNTVNDTPIVPPAIPIEDTPTVEEITEQAASEEPSTEDILSEVDQALESVGVDPVAASEALEEAAKAQEEVCEEPEEAAEEVTPDEAPTEEIIAQEEASEDPSAEQIPEEDSAEQATAEDIREEESATEAPCEEESGEKSEITDEVTQMLAQADDLIAHETPEPVVAPAPIDVPIPPRIVLPPDEEQESPEAPAEAEEAVPEEENSEEASQEEDEVPEEIAPAQAEENEPDVDPFADEFAPRRRGNGLITALICFIIAAALFLGGYVFYKYYYQQSIENIALSGYEDTLTVQLTTRISDDLLTVVCTDSYGNTKRQVVSDGTAVFTDLSPDTRYKVHVEIYGFHELVGMTSSVYITQEQTSIVSFSAVTGTESGSVILSFTAQGPETNEWKVTYFAEGEEEKSVTFTGPIVTVTGLTVGKNYTFQLEPTAPLYVVGEDTLEFTVSNLIYAENLSILGFSNGALNVVWSVPEGEIVESWTVRCYNDSGYDKTITVTEPAAVFEALDTSAAYTIEVTAAGMSQGSRAFVSANSITIKDMKADTTDPTRLQLSWGFEGTAPEGGWLVLYTVSGIAQQQVIQCSEPSAVISPMIPGASYSFTVQSADGNTIFGGTLSCTAPEAQTFSGYDIAAKYFKFSMCRTPSNENWDKGDVKKKNYTTEFKVGESASFAIDLEHEYSTSSDTIVTLFLICDSNGNVVSMNTQSRSWTDMWYRGFGKLTIPAMPATAGSYTVDIYFNGQHVTTQTFTVV